MSQQVKKRANMIAANNDPNTEDGKPNGATAPDDASNVGVDFTWKSSSARSLSVAKTKPPCLDPESVTIPKERTSFCSEEAYGGAKEDILELLDLLKHSSHSNVQRLRFAALLWHQSREYYI